MTRGGEADPFRLTLDGPASSDTGTPNPFLDFRLMVTFKTPGGATFAVPGYFAGDGDQVPAGSQWRVHFNPPEVGSYTYTVSFRSAAGIAIDTDPATGSALAPDGKTGAFNIGPTDKQEPDFRATGKLANVKQHYLRTIGDRFGSRRARTARRTCWATAALPTLPTVRRASRGTSCTGSHRTSPTGRQATPIGAGARARE